MSDLPSPILIPSSSSYINSRKQRIQFNKQQMSLSPQATSHKELNINKANVPTLELPFIPMKSEYEKTLLSSYTSINNIKKKLNSELHKNFSVTITKEEVAKMQSEQQNKPIEASKAELEFAQLIKNVSSLKKIAIFKNLKFSLPFTSFIDTSLETLQKCNDTNWKATSSVALLKIEEKWLKYLHSYNNAYKTIEEGRQSNEEKELTNEVSKLKAQIEQLNSREKEHNNTNVAIKKLEYYTKLYEELKTSSTKEIKELKVAIDALKDQNKSNKEKLAAYANQSIVSELRKKLESIEGEYAKYKDASDAEIKTLDSTVYRLQIEKCALKEEDKVKSQEILEKNVIIDNLTAELCKYKQLHENDLQTIASYDNSMEMMCKLLIR